MHTTLDAIRAHGPCADGWRELLLHLGKFKADDEPLPITTILDSNGLDDALWCLRAVDGHDREIRLYAVWCARQVQHLMGDPRSIAALDVAERYANGEATEAELDAAWAESVAAVEARAAAAAARAARAVEAAAEVAAAAVEARAAAAAARAARAAEAAAEVAALDAAEAAAGVAALDAAEAAAKVAWDAACAAAWAATRRAQADKLREICE